MADRAGAITLGCFFRVSLISAEVYTYIRTGSNKTVISYRYRKERSRETNDRGAIYYRCSLISAFLSACAFRACYIRDADLRLM